MSDKIDYSADLLGDRNRIILGSLNVHTDHSGKFMSLFQIQSMNDLSIIIPRLRSLLNLSFDEGSKFTKTSKD